MNIARWWHTTLPATIIRGYQHIPDHTRARWAFGGSSSTRALHAIQNGAGWRNGLIRQGGFNRGTLHAALDRLTWEKPKPYRTGWDPPP